MNKYMPTNWTNLGEMDKFWGTYNQEESENLNGPITTKEIGHILTQEEKAVVIALPLIFLFCVLLSEVYSTTLISSLIR